MVIVALLLAGYLWILAGVTLALMFQRDMRTPWFDAVFFGALWPAVMPCALLIIVSRRLKAAIKEPR